MDRAEFESLRDLPAKMIEGDVRLAAQNLHADVKARPELRGKSLRDVWRIFCDQASITHRGALICEGLDPATEVL